jgi:hypothetical protein
VFDVFQNIDELRMVLVMKDVESLYTHWPSFSTPPEINMLNTLLYNHQHD